MTAFFFLNFLVGLVIGWALGKRRIGCLALLPLCIAAIAQVSLWQADNPAKQTSTGSLDYLFAPLWVGLAGVVGSAVARVFKKLFFKGR